MMNEVVHDQERQAAARGMPNRTCPFCLKVQVLMSLGVDFAAKRGRIVFTWSSKMAARRPVELAVLGWYVHRPC